MNETKKLKNDVIRVHFLMKKNYFYRLFCWYILRLLFKLKDDIFYYRYINDWVLHNIWKKLHLNVEKIRKNIKVEEFSIEIITEKTHDNCLNENFLEKIDCLEKLKKESTYLLVLIWLFTTAFKRRVSHQGQISILKGYVIRSCDCVEPITILVSTLDSVSYTILVKYSRYCAQLWWKVAPFLCNQNQCILSKVEITYF